MFFDAKTVGDYIVIKLRGRIGGETSINFYKDIKELVSDEPQPYVVLDFEKVDFIDSSGLGSIVAINSTLVKANRSLILAGLPDVLVSLLKITNLVSVLNIVDKVEDAVK